MVSIGEWAFYGYTGELVVNCNIPSASSLDINTGAFVYSDFTRVTIGEGVTSIGDYAFSSCNNLVSITIPESVTSIGGSAFLGCSNLASVTIPESSMLTLIGKDAFNDCSSLTHMNIPVGVTSIGNWAFRGCSNLISLTIPASVTEIGKRAFSNCAGELVVNCNIPSASSYDEAVFYPE